ncbi:hypothetical protein SteCoe_16943 [Stentor coeruleus]|uniref:Steroid dehydrogenase n=1 Tax=Stentor coeruleus TaxID=5963 RepID=A0A1R2C055_9CILI|nr:hypothetical protein SteCoe_16943 [Stentor coeruleus]
MIEYIFFFIGFCCILKVALVLLEFLQGYSHISDIKKYGHSWAIITGATDGVGLAFAKKLAQAGFSLILISRNPIKLLQVARELNLQYGINTLTIAKDFNDCNKDPQEFFNGIYAKCQNLNITLLINNVGYGEKAPFIESLPLILRQISINIFPMVFLTRLILPSLISNGLGGIINIGSITTLRQFPVLIAVYSATKSFELIFSQTCSQEYNLDILCIEPSFINTKLTKIYRRKPFNIQPDEFVEASLCCLGRVGHSFGHWRHYISYFFYTVLGPFISILLDITN